eukprot:22637_1
MPRRRVNKTRFRKKSKRSTYRIPKYIRDIQKKQKYRNKNKDKINKKRRKLMRKYKSYKQPAELNNIEDTTNSDHHFQAAQILLLRFISDTIENILNLTTTKA